MCPIDFFKEAYYFTKLTLYCGSCQLQCATQNIPSGTEPEF